MLEESNKLSRYLNVRIITIIVLLGLLGMVLKHVGWFLFFLVLANFTVKIKWMGGLDDTHWPWSSIKMLLDQ